MRDIKSSGARILCVAALAAAAVLFVRLATAQHATPVVNGTIGLTEYGTNNSQASGGQTWYMTWDETNLYVGFKNANTSEAAVIYIDRHAITADAGTGADGNTTGQTYDNTNFASLPFRADFVAYFKDGYREYRTADGAGSWSAATTAFGSYASTAGTEREIAIPWSAVTGGGRPAQFNFFAYATSPAGLVYGQVPPENPGGLIGTSAIYTRFYRVADTDNGESTRPFTLNLAPSRTFVVNSTSDAADAAPGDNSCDDGAGNCTLRAAIQEANAVASYDVINFNVGGGGLQTIAPASVLPTVTDPVRIDGYTQPGSAANTLAAGDDAVINIELNGAGAGGAGLVITGGTTTVRGLVINRFAGRGIDIGGEDFNVVTGCFIGTDPGGTLDLGNAGDGIYIQGLLSGSDSNRIGGTLPAERNLISGNNGNGIGGAGGGANVIQGNYVGTDRNGAADLGNGGNGVVIAGSGSTLGGASAAARNVISGNDGVAGVSVAGGGHSVQGNYIGVDVGGAVDLGNTGDGISFNVNTVATGVGGAAGVAGQPPGNVISGNGQDGINIGNSSNVTVQGNLIGTNAAGTGAIGNGGDGIHVVAGTAQNNQIGGAGAGEANLIAFSGADGVFITGLNSTRNPVLSNSIHSNGGLGIDLEVNGVTPNDAGDPDAGGNRLQNFPVLTNVSTSGGATTVSGTLNSTPSSTFRVEFFSNQSCDASGNGEGQTFLGAKTVTTDATGNALFTSDPLPPVPASRQVAATATVTSDPADATNVNNTSEFSQCRQEVAALATFVVNSTGDAPDANLEDGVCSTAPLGVECTLRAAIQQANANPSADTINFSIPGATDAGCTGALGVCTITPATALPPVTQPATINGYTQPGSSENSLLVGFNGNLRVELNGAAAPAATDGLQLTAGSTTVRGLIINRFKGDGVELSGAGGNTVSGNFIGTNAAGTAAGPGNGTAAGNNAGVQITGGSANAIGGSAPQARNVISGNVGDGVRLTATAAANSILGNYVGTDRGGTLDVGNTLSGVSAATAGNQIGDAATTPGQAAGNVISGNDAHGVAIAGGGTNEVQGNLIGLQPDGATARGNALDGVNVTGAAAGNTVGGAAPGFRNVISSNGSDGVELNGAGVTGTVVAANYIGTSAAAVAGDFPDRGNGDDGVRIAGGATLNTVGGLTSSPGSSPGNVISGNNSDGVEINGSNSNTVLGNLIGLQPNGLIARRNEGNGVAIVSAASNTVGGYTAAARNVISAHNASGTTDGVDITNSASVNNKVVGNYIGTGVDGTETGLGNGGDGVRVAASADNNVIGGDDDDDGAGDGNVGARNVIGNNGGDGVEINGSGSTGNTVAGNYVGIDKDGVGDIGNAANGVLSSGASNTVGGSTAAPGTSAGNVISGNGADGVELSTNADSNLVRGNLIGLQADGVSIVPNVANGVHLTGARLCTVGGATPDLRNVISGNGANGVLLNEGQLSVADSNTVAGNYIGTDSNGALDRSNTADGVRIDGGDHNTIGGSAATPGAAPGNVISGNNSDGVELADSGGDTNSNVIAGNLIGAAAGGATPIANTGDGVRISAGVTTTTVGGATSDLRNVISGNGSDGVEINGTASGNVLQGNFVGTQASGVAALPNAANGVLIGASNNTVGGAAAGAGNTVAFNAGDGVHVQSGTGNAIRRNSIHSNGGLGIDLDADGVTPNDADDPDGGANDLQNFPVITDARTGSTVITGTLNSTPNTTFTVEFFYSAVSDPTAHGEGQNFLDSVSVTTDSGGDAAFTHTVAATTVPLGNVITATATSPAGNTSEFSKARIMLAPTLSRLREFEATLADGGGVALAWRTELEVDNLGFRLYREDAGERTLITPSLIAGSALAAGPGAVLTAGGSYAWADAAGSPASRYWLEDVDSDGVGTLHGPFWPTPDFRQARRPKKKQPRPSPLLEQISAPAGGAATGGQSPQRGWAAQDGVAETTAAGRSGAATARPGASLAPGRVAAAHPVAGLSGAPEPGAERQRVLAAGPAVKLSVRRPGWYRVGRGQLEAAGLSPLADPVRLQLFAGGVEQAIHVNALTWAVDGAVEFYGEGLDTLTTDARVYWLVEGQTAGRRTSAPSAPALGGRLRPQPFGATTAAPGGRIALPAPRAPAPSVRVGPPDPNAGFDYTIERRDRTIYSAGVLNGERSNFFGGVITPTAPAQPLAVRGLRALGGATARLELALQGLTAGPHLVRLTLNGAEVGTLAYAGRENRAAAFDVPVTLLREGDNEVGLTSAAPSDVSLTEYVRLTYRRAYRAESDRLSMTAEAGTATRVTGFTTAGVRVVDVTEPGSVTEVVAAVAPAYEDEAGGYAVTFTPAGTGRRTLLAFGEPAVSAVGEVRANRPSEWHAATNEADLVVITHADFRAAAVTLADRRASEGLAAVVADVEDIYDEFSYGARSAEAVRDFLLSASERWRRAPRYVLLVGDGSYDPRGHLGRGSFDFVPARLIDTALMETASDEWLADFDGDGLAEMNVGRLPVRTPAEAALVVSKIAGHAPDAAERRLLLVSDRRGADGFDFEAVTTSLLAHVPAGYEAVRIDRGARDAATVRAEIVGGVNSGPALVNYAGHGSLGVWTGEGMLRSADALALSNGTRLPVFAMMTCLNGYYVDLSLDSLSEALLKAEHGGAVAAWTSTGMTTPDTQAEMNRALYRALFESAGPLRLGDALRAARAATADTDVRRTWVLIGDPTTRWR